VVELVRVEVEPAGKREDRAVLGIERDEAMPRPWNLGDAPRPFVARLEADDRPAADRTLGIALRERSRANLRPSPTP
jgi:hypothetical protein